MTSPSRITSPYRQLGDRFGNAGIVLRQPVAREKLNVCAVLEREQADAVELSLENPLRPGERSCVSVAAMGTTHSGKEVRNHCRPARRLSGCWLSTVMQA